jgi:hypothetical protein
MPHEVTVIRDKGPALGHRIIGKHFAVVAGRRARLSVSTFVLHDSGQLRAGLDRETETTPPVDVWGRYAHRLAADLAVFDRRRPKHRSAIPA